MNDHCDTLLLPSEVTLRCIVVLVLKLKIFIHIGLNDEFHTVQLSEYIIVIVTGSIKKSKFQCRGCIVCKFLFVDGKINFSKHV